MQKSTQSKRVVITLKESTKVILTTGVSLLFMVGCTRTPNVSIPPFSDEFISAKSTPGQLSNDSTSAEQDSSFPWSSVLSSSISSTVSNAAKSTASSTVYQSSSESSGETKYDLTGKNIIFIQADQLAAGSLNCYGSGVDSTPTLDSLSEQGTKFNRAYAVNPVCAPNRANMLTSRSYQVHGVNTNNVPLHDQALTFAGALRENGYVTGGFGKFHQEDMKHETPVDPRFLGFDEGVIAEDTKWGQWLDWIRINFGDQTYDLALGSTWQHNLRRIPQDILDKAQSSRLKNYWNPIKTKSFWPQAYQSPMNASHLDDVFSTNNAIDFIETHKNKDKPFMLTLSFVAPHDPYDPPAPYSTMYAAEDMPEPIPNEWEAEGITYLTKNQATIGFYKIKDDVEAIKKMRAYYHGKLRMVDDQIKRVVDYVKNNGLWDNTVIVFTADHGDMMGDHELIAKWIPHYDKSIRVPLIAAGGGIKKGEINNMITSLDFFPTFLDLADVSKSLYTSLEGKSFEGYLYGRPVADKWDEVLINSHDIRSIITKDGMRYTKCYSTNEEQLFDLFDDPQELHNLVNDTKYTDLISGMESRIDTLLNRYTQFGELEKRDYFGNYPADVYINDCRIAFDDKPLTEGVVTYFPILKILDCLGAESVISDETITVKKAGKIMQYKYGENKFTLAGTLYDMQLAFTDPNGVLQAPVVFFEKYLEALGYNVEFDQAEKIMTITGLIF